MEYIKLTAPEIYKLPKDTLFTVVVSPVEVHGPHLPMGTDILIARYLQRQFHKIWHDTPAVKLPELPIGSDPQPVKGSFSAPSSALKKVLISWALSLQSMGFRYMLVFDNHGGPRHQIAIYRASRYMLKRDFYIIAPFLHIMHEMLIVAPEIEKYVGTKGMVGDATDLHGGTNETSLMLQAYPRLVKHPLPPHHKPSAGMLGKVMKKTMGTYGELLDTLIGWIREKENPGYVGNPQLASEERGKAMLAYHLRRYIELTKMAYAGTYTPHPPLTPLLRGLFSLVPEDRIYKTEIAP